MRTTCTRRSRSVAKVCPVFPCRTSASSWIPTSMFREADAADADSAAVTSTARRIATRLHMRRLPLLRPKHPLQPLLESDHRLPSQDLTCASDVWLADVRIVERKRLEDDLAVRPCHAHHCLCELENRELVGIAEIDRQVLVARR